MRAAGGGRYWHVDELHDHRMAMVGGLGTVGENYEG